MLLRFFGHVNTRPYFPGIKTRVSHLKVTKTCLWSCRNSSSLALSCSHLWQVVPSPYVFLPLTWKVERYSFYVQVHNACPFTIWYEESQFLITRAQFIHTGLPFALYFLNAEGDGWSAQQIFTDLHVAPNVPNFPTGFVRNKIFPSFLLRFCIDSWEAKPSTQVTFKVPDNWKAGRIWVSDVLYISASAKYLSCWPLG